MNKKYLKIVKLKDNFKGRCVECDARNICHKPNVFNCECDFYQQYKFDIKAERTDKIKNINWVNMFKINKISIFKKNPNFSKVNKRSKRTKMTPVSLNVIKGTSGSISHLGSSTSGVGGYSHKEILKDIDIKDINSYVTLYDKNVMKKLQNFDVFTLKQILRKEKLNKLKNNKDK